MSSPALQPGVAETVDGIPDTALIFGDSAAMRRIRANLERVGRTPVPVLITGESGTGKELMARLLHRQSEAEGAFVKLNCPAIPGTLLESELFGYEKGAFTGALLSKPGRIEQAEHGTLLLDEIGELELGLQSKLLQLLQDGQYMRLGGRTELRVNTRMVFATNRNLEAEMAAGRLRSDLYYRMNVVRIELPPLRRRREDIPGLARHFVRLYSRHFERAEPELAPDFLRALRHYDWPGNVRELENMMKRYVVLGGTAELMSELAQAGELELAPGDEDGVGLKQLTRQAVHELERSIILQALAAHRWHRKRTAAALHISYRALLYKLKQCGLQNEAEAPAAAGEKAAGVEVGE